MRVQYEKNSKYIYAAMDAIKCFVSILQAKEAQEI